MGQDTYLKNGEKKDCNGCGSCALICPVNAIQMLEDEEGFLYPKIDEKKCIKCNRCIKVCSNLVKENKYNIKAYATKNKSEIERMNSTSGGMFKVLANYVINKQGVVFGVKFNEELEAVHDYAETLDECKKFSHTRYVRSNLKNSYKKVKEFLENDRYVLFTGTPCQVQGLRTFLGKDTKKLLLCEIICHANPSPKILKMYIKNHEIISGQKVKDIHFRNKNKNMNNRPYLEFENGSKSSIVEYMMAFSGQQLINRPSCHNCQFVNENRKADFTIGDFWGVEKILPGFNDNKGISLLTVNSEKAGQVFNKIKNDIEYKEVDLKLAFKYNHNSNLPMNKKRTKFFLSVANGEINENNIISYLKHYTKIPFYKKVLRKIKNIL